MEIVQEQFKNRSIIYQDIYMYFISTAKEVVEFCRQNKIKISSIRAYSITGAGIKPSMKHSIGIEPNELCWDVASTFLSNINDSAYLYEIWYQGYANIIKIQFMHI